eukprot:TRINITY_DN85282_c0_g1_i1.p1 TRINITY_DN85282_c0_g1~~TRINITY_DN85282_c0_g1_i1.p1  ORF type:complete len:167 (+),score=18.27 TRINITY_DN85282_c0_g1_i1:89-589(+)
MTLLDHIRMLELLLLLAFSVVHALGPATCQAIVTSAKIIGDACMDKSFTHSQATVEEFKDAEEQICSCYKTYEKAIEPCKDDAMVAQYIADTAHSYYWTCYGYKWGAWGWKYGLIFGVGLVLVCGVCCCIQCVVCGRGSKARSTELESGSESDSNLSEDSIFESLR